MSDKIPAIVLGGTGYVAGELLRLIAAHPNVELKAVLSDSQPGEPLGKWFPHLSPVYPSLKFSDLKTVLDMAGSLPSAAILCAAPHGVAAGLIDQLLSAAEAGGTNPHVIDISADFRYGSAQAYEAVYRHPHGAPQRIPQFTCALPEHLDGIETPHVSHPGCFSTAVLLPSVPLLKLDLVEPHLFVTGVTGSTGSGRTPTAGTHHPQRHSDFYAYNPLAHRHAPEIAAIARASSGVDAELSFIPHSAPFARGIHVTVQAVARRPLKSAQLLDALREFYAGEPFVHVSDAMPHVKDVVGSNFAVLGGATNGSTIVLTCVEDNLTKGAAGGAMQWLNRLFGLPETAGLTMPAPGWT